jgi:hypothetical protein
MSESSQSGDVLTGTVYFLYFAAYVPVILLFSKIMCTLFRLEVAHRTYHLYRLEGRRVRGRINKLCQRNPTPTVQERSNNLCCGRKKPAPQAATVYEVEIRYEYESPSIPSSENNRTSSLELTSVREEGEADCFTTDIFEVPVDHSLLFSNDGQHSLRSPLLLPDGSSNNYSSVPPGNEDEYSVGALTTATPLTVLPSIGGPPDDATLVTVTVVVSQHTYLSLGVDNCALDLVVVPDDRPMSGFPKTALDEICDDLFSPEVLLVLRCATLVAIVAYAALVVYLLCGYFVPIAVWWVPKTLNSYFYLWNCKGPRPYTPEIELLYTNGLISEGTYNRRPPLPALKYTYPHRYEPNLANDASLDQPEHVSSESPADEIGGAASSGADNSLQGHPRPVNEPGLSDQC